MYTTGWVIKKVGTDKFYSGSVKGGIFTGIYSSKIYQKYENAVKALKKCQDRYLTECQICTVKLSIEIALKCDTRRFLHKKTGNIYNYLGEVTDCTNKNGGEVLCVLYERNGKLFIREKNEFFEKFEKVEE